MRSLLTLLLLALSAVATAQQVRMETTITSVFVDPVRHGNCGVLVGERIRDATGLDCNGTMVSFSCDGRFHGKDVAYRMLDLAQMAFALEYPVEIEIDDTRKAAGACVATRITVND